MRIRLLESKADEQKLRDFAGDELADLFFKQKQRLKSPENDIYYWLKKSPEELENRLKDLSSTQTRKQKSDTAREGAELVAENEYYKVYHITTYEASVKYGKNTQWCISGSKRWSNGERGEEYFDDYTSKGVQFYFFIPKTSKDGKYAIAFTPKNKMYQIFNETDDEVNDIPNAPTVEGVYTSLNQEDKGEFTSNDLDIKYATLLSVDEANTVDKRVRRYQSPWQWWWLRSPGDLSGFAAYNYGGTVHDDGYGVNDGNGVVRPALKISNLRSFNLKPYNQIKINGIKFVVISDDMVLHNDEIMHHRFDEKSNDYEKSEIKQFIDNWFNNNFR